MTPTYEQGYEDGRQHLKDRIRVIIDQLTEEYLRNPSKFTKKLLFQEINERLKNIL